MTLVHVPSGPGRAQLRMHLALMATWILWGWSCGSPVFRLPSCCGEPPSSGWEQTNPTNMERGGFWWNLISDHLRSLWSKDYRSSRLLLTGVFQLYRVIYIYISDVHVMARDLYSLFSRMLVFYLDIFSLNMIPNFTIYYYFTCY